MTMSPRAVAAAMVQETDEREVCLLTITHPVWATPIRISTDQTEYLGEKPDDGSPRYGTISRGETYEYFPIIPVVPDSHDEQPPTGKVSIENVTRIVSPYLRMIDDEYPRVTVEVVLASTPDIVDQVWPELELQTSSMDASRVETTITMDVAEDEAVPWMRFIPALFHNLHS